MVHGHPDTGQSDRFNCSIESLAAAILMQFVQESISYRSRLRDIRGSISNEMGNMRRKKSLTKQIIINK